MKTATGIDPPHVSSVSSEPVLRSFLVLLNIDLHAGIMHKCPTPNIRIHEHFKTFPEETILPDTLPPLNPWLDYKAHHTEACMVLQLSPLFLLLAIYVFMAKMGFHLVHIPFLDAAAKYSVLLVILCYQL